MRWHKGAIRGSVIAGGYGKEAANQYIIPFDLSFDRNGYLYVSDLGNYRVQRFSLE